MSSRGRVLNAWTWQECQVVGVTSPLSCFGRCSVQPKHQSYNNDDGDAVGVASLDTDDTYHEDDDGADGANVDTDDDGGDDDAGGGVDDGDGVNDDVASQHDRINERTTQRARMFTTESDIHKRSLQT